MSANELGSDGRCFCLIDSSELLTYSNCGKETVLMLLHAILQVEQTSLDRKLVVLAFIHLSLLDSAIVALFLVVESVLLA